MVKQPKKDLYLFDDTRIYYQKESVPWGSSENGRGDEFLPSREKIPFLYENNLNQKDFYKWNLG